MSESSIPTAAAAVAAPILKLWPEYLDASTPDAPRASRTCFTSPSLVSGVPPANLKNGPCDRPLTAKYAATAATGHNPLPVFPRYTETPFLKGSVLDALIRTCTVVGDVTLSSLTSPSLRWEPASYSFAEGTVTSPDRKKPKKHVQHAAHSIMPSWSCGVFSQNSRSSLR